MTHIDPRNLPAGLDWIGNALLAIDDTLTEILDRLPERETECGNVWRDEADRPCTQPSGHNGNHVDEAGMRWAASPEPAPADVDPDGALAKVLRAAFEGRDEMSWAEVALLAREQILTERGGLGAKVVPALKRQITDAEADLARVTKERNDAGRLANRNADTARDFEDRYETSHANFLAVSSDLDRVTKERDEQTRDAIEWRNRYEALRADVEAYMNRIGRVGPERAMGRWILDRDNEKAKS